MWLRQSTASQEIQLGKFVDDTDGKTAETGLSIANTDIKLWKEGATTQSNKNSGGATHIANGYYYAVLDATDTNTLGKLEVTVDVAGALAVRREFMVVPAMVYDSLVLGTDVLQTDVTQFNGTNGTFSSGRPEVNTTHAAGVAWGSGAITAASIAASALNGKGDWNIGKTGYELSGTQTFNLTGNITGDLSGNVGGISGITFPTGFSSLANGPTVTDIWTHGTRTLTSNGNDITVADVWSYGTRELTAGSSLTAADVWGYSTRELTSGSPITAADVWSYGTRELTGSVTVGTNNDKTGYSLSQTFPTNFSSLVISGAGKVTVGTNDDKTDYVLSTVGVSAVQSGLATSASLTTVEGKIDTIDGIVDSILVDTTEIGVAGAGLTALAPAATALSTSVWTGTRAGYLDNLSGGAVALATGVNVTSWRGSTPGTLDSNGFVPSNVAAINGNTTRANNLASFMDSGYNSGTNLVLADIKRIDNSASAAQRLSLSANAIVPGTVESSTFTPTTTQFQSANITEVTTDHYKGRVIIFTSGALLAQASPIIGYSLNSGEGRFTVGELTEAPSDNDTFIII